MSGIEGGNANTTTRTVRVGRLGLEGFLAMPDNPVGLVIFAHGSGSSRLSPRNTFVAGRFNAAGLATLLFDLLTPEEASDRGNVFDIPLLGTRVAEAVSWASSATETHDLALGLFGASTGAAAALVAAACLSDKVAAVVSRGGRPDLAETQLQQVTAPTMLIVGGADDLVLELNKAALARLSCEKQLCVIPGATHLFEEPGTLDQVVVTATSWFCLHMETRHPEA